MRSLILAGGGIKVGYQAGCLHVFHQLGLTFDHVDAASGGCFNAAMMASGMTGTQIADQWRNMPAGAFTTIDWENLYKTVWTRSLGTDAGLKRIIRDIWKMNFGNISTCTSPVFTFNHYDFTQKRVVIVENKDLTEDLLIAGVSLVVWLPAVAVGTNQMFDAVWCTDGNVGEAVRRGADEIWAIWTVSNTPELRNGALAQYFHLIETVANAKFNGEWAEIVAVNAAIAAHGKVVHGRGPDLQLRSGFDPIQVAKLPPPPGRKTIVQHLIRQEVPVHYLFNFSRDRMAAAVEMGIRDTTDYARSVGLIPTSRVFPVGAPVHSPSVEFRETMRGFFMPTETDPRAGGRAGRVAGNALTVRLAISTRDLDRFLHRPEHLGTATGAVDCPLLCGTPMPATGTFALFVNSRDGNGITVPGQKRMVYALEFADTRGTRYRLTGEKRIFEGRGLSVWPDTTTLYVHIESRSTGTLDWTPFGAGIMHVELRDFLVELTTFRVRQAAGVTSAAKALERFGVFWVGQLWDVYARKILDYAPF